MDKKPDVTQLLVAWGSGDRGAREQLIPIVYHELHRLAQRHMARERDGHTLQASALVHETYMKLVDVSRIHWRNRAHFFAVAGGLMRQILVDFARRRQRLKRGGRIRPVTFDDGLMVPPRSGHDVVAINDALEALEKIDPRKVRVVELRFFVGLSIEETAEALEVSEETVQRDWRTAKVWLCRELSADA
jgi:RNA polymerase sigma factor (TIGR02999 family)